MARLIPFEGGRNFRDLGGYATDDGRRVLDGYAPTPAFAARVLRRAVKTV